MNGDSTIHEEDDWTAVAAALKETRDIPLASPDFTQRCLRAALASLPQNEGTERTAVRDNARRWWRIAAVLAALIGGVALAAVGTRAFLSPANDDVADATTSTVSESTVLDDLSAASSRLQSAADTSTTRLANSPTDQLANFPTDQLTNLPTTQLTHSPTTQGDSMNTATTTATLLAAATLATTATAAELPRLDSSKFAYKYEMIALPTAEDLDGTGANDFTGAGSWITLGSGANVGTISMSITTGTQNINSGATSIGTAGDGWRKLGATTAANGGTGYSVEVRLKVTESTGTKGALVLNASTGDSSVNSWLVFKDGKLAWGHNKNVADIADIDGGWHTYRLVREPGTTVHSVWMDGVLVGSNLSSGIDASINRLLLGAANSDYAGKAEVMWLRFDKGAYAPPDPNDKSRRKASTDFAHQYEMAANDARFAASGNATTSGTEWTASVGNAPTVTLNGILSMNPNGKNTAYWATKDGIWKDVVTPDTSYTVDFRARINSCNIDGIDRTLNFMTGTTGPVGSLYVGTNSVSWCLSSSGAGTYVTLDTGDNTDAMHLFRIAYSGGGRHAFTVWRDGVKIGENLVDCTNFFAYQSGSVLAIVRFGVVSTSTHGGSFDIDYVRWDTTGAWEWKDPPKGFVMVVR